MDGVVNLIAQRVGEETRVRSYDIPIQVAESLDTICKELGRVYKLMDGKANVEFLLSLAGSYKIIKLNGEEVPDRTPEDIIRNDILPYLATMELVTETHEGGIDVGDINGTLEEEVS